MMESRFQLGIPEIDVQHEEIARLVASLQEVIARKSQRYMVGPALKRLNQLLLTHFAAEEALMGMVGYQGLAQHKKIHNGMLQLFDDYFRKPPPVDDSSELGRSIGEKVLGHVMEHDLQMTAMVRDYLRNLSGPSPGSDVPKRS
jgi:hemerythrin